MTGSAANPSSRPEQPRSLAVPAPHEGRSRHAIWGNLIDARPPFQTWLGRPHWPWSPKGWWDLGRIGRLRVVRHQPAHIPPRVDPALTAVTPWQTYDMSGSADTKMERPFLLSKATVPEVRPGLVPRPRLLEALDRASVTIVVAPAGWGKTTLLAQWARESARDQLVAWLTLDSTDDDPVRFWNNLIISLRRAGSEAGESAISALRVAGLDPLEVAVPTLINDLVETGNRQTIILDDFHVLEDRRIGEAVEYFASYLPAHVTLVIGSRVDPPLPTALWRVRGTLAEVRAEQLSFSSNEAVELVGRVASIDLDGDRTRDLIEQTGGWAAGLQVTALAVRDAEDPIRQLEAMGTHQILLDDYVLNEVVASMTEEQRDFIMRVSVLEHLSAPLCDAALGIERSAEILDRLDRTDPFLARLGRDGQWFQYHSLVRDVLRREFVRGEPAEGERVLRRAASWFLENDDPEQAIRYSIDAGEGERAGELLLRHEDEFLDRGQIGSFLTLADSLGPAAIEADPRLGVAMAWADGSGASGDRVVELLNRAESAMTGDEPPPTGWLTLAGSAAALRAIYGHDATGEIGYRDARRAVELENDQTLPGYAVARMALGLALAGRGRFDEAIPHLNEAWVHSDIPDMPVFARLPIAGLLTGTLVSAGRLEEAHQVLEAAGPTAHRVERALGDAAGPAVASVRFAEGVLDLVEGNVARAREGLARAVSLARVASNPSLLVRALTMLADADMALGDDQAARRAVDEARDLVSSESVFPATVEALGAVETRIGRSAIATARAERRLYENLTDRELSVLRALSGPLTQREIGRELYLSINTVKGYTKSLYRKLGVTSRAEAVAQAKELGLV